MLKDALWIGCPEIWGEVCPEFIKNIVVNREVSTALLCITAAGVYEARLNGKRIGDFILAPGCTVYQKRLQYQTYDVTELLMKTNQLTVMVGTGWYRGHISEKSKEIHNTPCALIAELFIRYTDGTSETILTDGSWSVRKSHVLFSDIYDGEFYDASAESMECVPARLMDLSKDNLIPQEGETVCEHERIKPVRYFVSPKGERIIDFGQNLAGYLELVLTAAKGTKIVISHGEVLDNDGNFYTENYRKAKAQLHYICREGKQVYKPHFTFYGFRYIRLDEYPGEVNLDDFTAVALYSDMKRTGYLVCSNEKINQLFSNTLWSQRSNFIDIPTDCPQRDERMGWTGDAQVFAKTACYNYNVKRFFEKWMHDVCAEQRENGSVPDTVPNFWQLPGASAAWGDAVTIVPWQVYLMYGDAKILQDSFEGMRRWIEYIAKDTLEPFLWVSGRKEKHYGDWLALDAEPGSYRGVTEEDFIASAFYAYSVSILIKTGKVLEKDVSEYKSLYDRIVHAFKERFSELKTQTEHVLALQFGLTDHNRKTAQNLVKMIKDNGNQLKTGFVGTPYLLHVLSKNGYHDTAYDLLLQEEYPSWLYEVNRGATTIWEHWDGIRDDGTFWSSDMNSYNHYAYGSVVDWIYTVSGGINPVEAYPGFERIQIAPVPDKRLKWLAVSVKTAYGVIRSKWIYQETAVRYEIVTPSPAEIVIDGKGHSVEKGSYVFYGKY